MGARNVLCLSGDPIHLGDHPDATVVRDIDVLQVVQLAKGLREHGTTMGGSEIADPPRFLIGVADMPLADPYDPARLEQKLDAGADVIWTQIAYDVEALAAWADIASPSWRVRAGEGPDRDRAAADGQRRAVHGREAPRGPGAHGR